MENSSCEFLSRSFPIVSEVGSLRWTNLVSFMFKNSVLSNSAIIYVVGKTSSLRKTLKTLLLNLAFTDFGVGLIIQPSQWSQQSIDDYNLKYAFFINLSTFCIAWVFWLYVWSGSWQFTCGLQAYCCWGNLNMAELCSFLCGSGMAAVGYVLIYFPGGVGLIFTTLV